ncbi:sigma54 specific transcriptional regulator, Fis family [Alkaliphilus metalliredigens QYMF]|uniref:Sigma54 specific transcriptional regulator, Fis family n=1 Tax=Alkaliphilus metalliredigens (strain QYMF) TaxID=293826 RepID=A6TVH4_ALKMQ|nr:sigma-54-dependent Fis family transcriptional regulator [Alkaliphilus metalliredigens]ABR50192.1 sigma54 specific transcriptional regulator, Fis family [Alkaliphilus metalliredigens QYMF]
MYLAEIKETASQFAKTISEILDVDVMIIDDNYHRIANTFRYNQEEIPINRYTIVGETMHTGKVVVVKNKGEYEHCKNCPDLDECAISGLISVPIFLESKVVGVFALLIPINKISPIFENFEVSIDFLESMAELLSSKLKNIDDYNKLNLIKKQREIIIDMIEDGLVFVNDMGEVVHYNHQFENFFKIEGDIYGNKMKKILDHPFIHEIILLSNNFSHKLFYYEQKNHSFYGFLSYRNININGINHGALLTFKSLGAAYNELNEISNDKANVSFSDILGKDPKLIEKIEMAKKLAVIDESILICGETGLGKTMLVRAIHNFSDRSKKYFAIVDCSNTSYDLLEKEIFGSENNGNVTSLSIGKLRMAHKGTIFFNNICQMPLYLQKRLVEVIKTKELEQRTYKGFHIDVRFIFDTSNDLTTRVKQGMFNEELYFRISKNIIKIPPLLSRKGDIKIVIDSVIEALKIKHLKPHLEFSQDVLETMYKYAWPKNIREIQRTIDLIIGNADDSIVRQKDIIAFDFHRLSRKDLITLDDAEKELIKKMLKQYNCKDDIAKAMGIGRATLYRKLKKYELNQ